MSTTNILVRPLSSIQKDKAPTGNSLRLWEAECSQSLGTAVVKSSPVPCLPLIGQSNVNMAAAYSGFPSAAAAAVAAAAAAANNTSWVKKSPETQWEETRGRTAESTVPYTGNIEGGLKPGTLICINGFTQPNAKRFHINLQCGANLSASDVAFHFSVHFDENCVVRNSQINRQWGTEERSGDMPFVRGQNFEVIFLVEVEHYKVAVNGKHFTEFRHRLPPMMVNTLHIYEDVRDDLRLLAIRIQAAGGGPAVAAFVGYASAAGTAAAYEAAYSSTTNTSSLQYFGNIPGGMYPLRRVHVRGVPHSFPKSQTPSLSHPRFQVNLQCGSSQYPPADVALHFQVRFDENCVVRNTMIGGTWGTEERQASYFPFMPNTSFDLVIMCDQDNFKVAINGQPFVEYQHRIQPLNRIDKLLISGDVNITQISIPQKKRKIRRRLLHPTQRGPRIAVIEVKQENSSTTLTSAPPPLPLPLPPPPNC